MSYVGALAVLILTFILWGLSHKYFRFIYFGNIGNAILKEIFECFMISLIIVSFIGAAAQTVLSGIVSFFGGILSWVGGVLLFLIKAVLILGGIALGIGLLMAIVNLVSFKKNNGDASENGPNSEMLPSKTPDSDISSENPKDSDSHQESVDVSVTGEEGTEIVEVADENHPQGSAVSTVANDVEA